MPHLIALRDTDLSLCPAGQRTGGDRGGYGGDLQLPDRTERGDGRLV